MNFFIVSAFCCSSLVGKPICFCLWSYIIFSTVARVSPSRSLSCEFSGCTFLVSISGSPRRAQRHHSMSFFFASVNTTVARSSTVQKQSSGFTSPKKSASSNVVTFEDAFDSEDLIPNVRCFFLTSHTTERAGVSRGTRTRTSTSESVWVHV